MLICFLKFSFTSRPGIRSFQMLRIKCIVANPSPISLLSERGNYFQNQSKICQMHCFQQPETFSMCSDNWNPTSRLLLMVPFKADEIHHPPPAYSGFSLLSHPSWYVLYNCMQLISECSSTNVLFTFELEEYFKILSFNALIIEYAAFK